MRLKEELREIAHKNGATYFGVAPASRIKNLPDGHRPQDLLPNAKSVIVLGMRISDAAIRANKRPLRGFATAFFLTSFSATTW